VSRFNNGNGRQQNNASHQDDPPIENEGGSRQPPAATLIAGRLRVVIWENEAKEGKWYSFTLTRSYKDNKGQWQQAATLGRDDALAASELLRLAYHKIIELSGGR
jgi:hypothetical protein